MSPEAIEEATVVEAVRQAKDHTRPEEVIEGVKKAVADEIRRLDPLVKIRKTEYFNHSYVPDLVAVWRESGKEQERHIFIRGSLTSVVAGEDVIALADQNPLLIGLSDDKGKVLSALRSQMPKSTRTLATNVSATGRITSQTFSGDSESQLSGLVRANIVRGGRGILGDTEAQRIVAVENEEPAEALKAFQKTVAGLFVGATAERLNRTVGLLATFFEANPNAELLSQLREQPLADSELRVVLPYVLQRAEDVASAEVWDALSANLTLEQIESMSGALVDLDLTPLVRSAARTLVAGRSAVFLNLDPDLTEDEKDNLAAFWTVRNGRLVADVHRWVLWMGSNARKIKGRDDGADARWDELDGPLRKFDLTAIQLHGLSRQLAVANVDADTVREDVQRIRQTIQDDFHVASVTVRERGEDDAPGVAVDFATSTATGRASVHFHVRAAALLAVKRPFTEEDIRGLIGND